MVVMDMYMSGRDGRSETATKAFEKLTSCAWKGLVIYVSRKGIYEGNTPSPVDVIERSCSDAIIAGIAACGAIHHGAKGGRC